MTLSGTRWDVLRNMSPTVWFLHLASKLHQRRWTNLRAILENILLMISIINYFPVVFIWAIILQATAGGFFPNNNYYFCSFAIWVWMGLLCCAVENTGKSCKYTVPVSPSLRHLILTWDPSAECDIWGRECNILQDTSRFLPRRQRNKSSQARTGSILLQWPWADHTSTDNSFSYLLCVLSAGRAPHQIFIRWRDDIKCRPCHTRMFNVSKERTPPSTHYHFVCIALVRVHSYHSNWLVVSV